MTKWRELILAGTVAAAVLMVVNAARHSSQRHSHRRPMPRRLKVGIPSCPRPLSSPKTRSTVADQGSISI